MYWALSVFIQNSTILICAADPDFVKNVNKVWADTISVLHRYMKAPAGFKWFLNLIHFFLFFFLPATMCFF